MNRKLLSPSLPLLVQEVRDRVEPRVVALHDQPLQLVEVNCQGGLLVYNFFKGVLRLLQRQLMLIAVNVSIDEAVLLHLFAMVFDLIGDQKTLSVELAVRDQTVLAVVVHLLQGYQLLLDLGYILLGRPQSQVLNECLQVCVHDAGCVMDLSGFFERTHDRGG